MVVTTIPIITGIKFLRASSNGSTPQIAATGINAHGMMVNFLNNYEFCSMVV
ncbi:hypothetical protein [Heyndrickxia oleronia]|uniref:Uncharacterized protein n=1 Tax=Heyndrickxia oleronia TaxID=38875 RepID=A0AAW6T1X2_9BACI|nr:hypothetical protein [Heyndrickxia oleronia]MDH5163538.1 hypothetical protein [Heyndrickxia oleronia]